VPKRLLRRDYTESDDKPLFTLVSVRRLRSVKVRYFLFGYVLGVVLVLFVLGLLALTT
jgi:hypothetical protein